MPINTEHTMFRTLVEFVYIVWCGLVDWFVGLVIGYSVFVLFCFDYGCLLSLQSSNRWIGRKGARDEDTNGDANRTLIRWICVDKIPIAAIKYMHASTHAIGYTQIPIIRWTKSIWRTELMQCINTYVYIIHLSREKDKKREKKNICQ